MQDYITSGNFAFRKTSIEGVIIVETKKYCDDRGYFVETYKKEDFVKGGIDVEFVQDNHSLSSKGVLRGLHYQEKHPQSKLVRVVEGEVFDVCVDLRPDSPTFGKWESCILTPENGRQFFIPRGFAHGFLVLSERAQFCYKCDDVYHPGDEAGLMYDDKTLSIAWPAMDTPPLLSEKDKYHPSFEGIAHYIKKQYEKENNK